MAIPSKIKSYLTKSKLKYKALKHEVAYTAQEIAAAAHVPGKQVVKCVVVKSEKGYFLAALPAIHLIDFTKLKKVAKAKKASLASEREIAKLVPDAEVGAMPPFGPLYNLPVYVDKALTDDEEIVVNAGTHTDLLKLRYADFVKAVKPKVGPFGKPIPNK